MDREHIDKEASRVAEGGEADHAHPRQRDIGAPDGTVGQVKYADNEGGGEQPTQRGSTRTATLEDRHLARNQREQEQRATEGRAQTSHHEAEDICAFPRRDPAKKKTGEF